VTRVADPMVPGFLGRLVDAHDGVLGTCFQVVPGVLVTAYHVVPDVLVGDRVRVGQLDGSDIVTEATVVGIDPEHDLAVLEIPRPLRQSRGDLAMSDTVRPGTEVAVIGWAAGVFDPDHTHEIHQAVGEWCGLARLDGGTRLCRVRLDALMQGMSGAPVMRVSDGAIVGVVSGRYNSADGWLAQTGWIARVEDLAGLHPKLRQRGSERRHRGRVGLLASLSVVGAVAVAAVLVESAGEAPDRSLPHAGASSLVAPGPKPKIDLSSAPTGTSRAPSPTGGTTEPTKGLGNHREPATAPTRTSTPNKTPTPAPSIAADNTTTLVSDMWMDADSPAMPQTENESAPAIDVHIGPDQWYPADGARLGLRTGATCQGQALPAQTKVNFKESGFDRTDTAVLCLRSRENRLYQFKVAFLDTTGPFAPYRVTRTSVT